MLFRSDLLVKVLAPILQGIGQLIQEQLSVFSSYSGSGSGQPGGQETSSHGLSVAKTLPSLVYKKLGIRERKRERSTIIGIKFFLFTIMVCGSRKWLGQNLQSKELLG